MERATPSARVAANIRAELARHRTSGSALARHLGIPQSAVSRRLNGHVAFDLDQLPAIAEFLGVPVAALLADPPDVAGAISA